MKHFPSYILVFLTMLTLQPVLLCQGAESQDNKPSSLVLDPQRLARLSSSQNAKISESVVKNDYTEHRDDALQDRFSAKTRDSFQERQHDDYEEASDHLSREELDRLLAPRKDRRAKYADELSAGEMIKYGIGALAALSIFSYIAIPRQDVVMTVNTPVGPGSLGVNVAPIVNGAKDIVQALPEPTQKNLGTVAENIAQSAPIAIDLAIAKSVVGLSGGNPVVATAAGVYVAAKHMLPFAANSTGSVSALGGMQNIASSLPDSVQSASVQASVFAIGLMPLLATHKLAELVAGAGPVAAGVPGAILVSKGLIGLYLLSMGYCAYSIVSSLAQNAFAAEGASLQSSNTSAPAA